MLWYEIHFCFKNICLLLLGQIAFFGFHNIIVVLLVEVQSLVYNFFFPFNYLFKDVRMIYAYVFPVR